VIRYQLTASAANKRALAAALVRAATSMAPVVLCIVLLRRVGWAPTVAFWAVAAALCGLVVVRAVVGYSGARRRLASLAVTLEDDSIRVDGSLGGLRVEGLPDPRTRVVHVASVPRGGPGYGEVRASLASWRPIDRRGRRGPAVRLAIGALVVAGIFFLPFVLDDFVARSRLLGAALVAGTWLVMRAAVRGR
jgi:hypothetical protein